MVATSLTPYLDPGNRQVFFVSLVHYACLFVEDPEGKVSSLNSGLTDEQALLFQQVAWQTVQQIQSSPRSQH